MPIETIAPNSSEDGRSVFSIAPYAFGETEVSAVANKSSQEVVHFGVHESLAQVEIPNSYKRNCKGYYEGKAYDLDGKEYTAKYEADFDYYYAELTTNNFDLSPEQKKYLGEELGLEQMNFKVFSRAPGEIGELKGRNVYVLIHGWTANHHIFSDIKKENDLTFVEEILARDPDALVIGADVNGFGETRFKKELLKDKTLKDKCTVEAGAAQVDFLLTEVLGLRHDFLEVTHSDGTIEHVEVGNQDVKVLGHSMGGAIAKKLAQKGYKAVACAPAAFPNSDDRKLLQDSMDFLPTNNRAPRELRSAIYNAVGGSMGLAHKVEQMGPVGKWVSTTSVNTVFGFIGPELMGTYVTGTDADREMLSGLNSIHVGELPTGKRLLVKEAFLNLERGVESLRSPEDVLALRFYENLTIVSADEDRLVPEGDVITMLRTEYLRAKHALDIAMLSNHGPSIELAIQAVDAVAEKCEDALSGKNSVPGGHYASLFHKSVVDKLINELN